MSCTVPELSRRIINSRESLKVLENEINTRHRKIMELFPPNVMNPAIQCDMII